MDAQELNDITYTNTNELTENPQVTCRDEKGNFYEIVDHETDIGSREPGEPFVLVIREQKLMWDRVALILGIPLILSTWLIAMAWISAWKEIHMKRKEGD